MIVVEGGTGLANANSYGSYAEFVAYWSDRGFTPTRTQAQIEADLIISTQYIELNNVFKGSLATETQALSWPRKDCADKHGRAIANNVVPYQVKNALFEYARRQGETALQPDQQPNTNGQIVSESKSLGALSKSVTYKEDSAYQSVTAYPMADAWLTGLVASGVTGFSLSLGRAL